MSSKLHWKQSVTIYLIHFDEPYKHARHYLGSTSLELEARIAQHRSGQGSHLIKAVVVAKISWEVVRTWLKVPRYHESKLHKYGNTKRLCPICSGDIAYERGNHKWQKIT